jgi:parallel beta-helix repeat protein
VPAPTNGVLNGIVIATGAVSRTNNRIENNSLSNNSTTPNFPAIFVGQGTNTSITANRVTGTNSVAIFLTTGATGTTVTGNQALQNTGDGINVRPGTSGTRLIGNTASNNGDDGIELDTRELHVRQR